MNLQGWDTLSPSLQPSTIQTIKRLGFDTMTPVQASTIPLFMSHKDVVVQAVTGSGKTLAFVVPILEILLSRKTRLKKLDIGTLIVTPTRELAEQISKVVDEFLKDSPITFVQQLLIGGTDLDMLSERLLPDSPLSSHSSNSPFCFWPQDTNKYLDEGAQIIIGTPGRVEAFMGAMEHQANFKELEILVLDEADRLLDLGFYGALSFIFHKVPKQRRTGLFSATQTKAVTDLARVGMRNPVSVDIKITTRATGEEQVIPSSLNNMYMMVDLDKKLSHFIHFLQEHQEAKIICYFLTCNVVDYIYKAIINCDFLDRGHVFSIHGHVAQERRKGVYQSFLKLRTGVLLTTDLASRGLDIADVDWIVQYDAPQNPAAFVHRIGRTARMGRSGNALVFLTPEESEYIDFLNVKKIPITETPVPESITDVSEAIKKAAMADRELFLRSQTAMVSYVRGYKEHHCAFIFDLKKLNMASLAKCFALLKLPVMPELRKRKQETYEGQLSYEELEKIPFKDPKSEKVRLEKLDQDKAERIKGALQKKEELKKKRVAKYAKKQEDKRLKRTSKDRFWEEYEELAKEEREYKKKRRRLITLEEYDNTVGNTELMGLIDPEEEEEKEEKRGREGGEGEEGEEEKTGREKREEGEGEEGGEEEDEKAEGEGEDRMEDEEVGSTEEQSEELEVQADTTETKKEKKKKKKKRKRSKNK